MKKEKKEKKNNEKRGSELRMKTNFFIVLS
jgi:hypothetical protein